VQLIIDRLGDIQNSTVVIMIDVSMLWLLAIPPEYYGLVSIVVYIAVEP
jgi:hypothetical protein